MSPNELVRCAATLRELAADPAVFLDKQSPEFTALSEVRREANRLIDAVKGSVRAKRGQPTNSKTDSQPAPMPTDDKPRIPKAARSLAEPSGVCYSCEDRIEQFHPRYNWMCQACGEWNWHKREQHADLAGRGVLPSLSVPDTSAPFSIRCRAISSRPCKVTPSTKTAPL